MATFTTSDDEWMINVTPGPNAKFGAGPADVAALATLTDPLTLRPVPEWNATVTLQERPH